MTTPVPGSGSYLALPVTVDPDALAANAIAYLAAQQPGWVAREGHLEVWLIRALARMSAETAQVAAQVPLAIFQYFGTQLLQLPPLVGAAAAMPSTWTLTDTLGHTIPAGTTVAYRTSSSSLILFQTVADVVVPAGQSTTATGAVALAAVNVGTDANGLPAGALTLVDNLAWVTSVVSTAVSAGGVNAEDVPTYLNRLTAELELLAPRPILPADFAALARNQTGVARATALDGYNPVGGTSGNARMVAVAVIDQNGAALSTAAQNAVAAALQAQREVNFVVNVVAPTYTTVNITTQVVAVHGADVNGVQAACQAALTAYLSPANWGGPPPSWTNNPTVRMLTVAAILGAIPNVSYVSSVQIGIGAGSLAAADGTLPGAIPLPTIGAINVTVQQS